MIYRLTLAYLLVFNSTFILATSGLNKAYEFQIAYYKRKIAELEQNQVTVDSDPDRTTLDQFNKDILNLMVTMEATILSYKQFIKKIEAISWGVGKEYETDYKATLNKFRNVKHEFYVMYFSQSTPTEQKKYINHPQMKALLIKLQNVSIVIKDHEHNSSWFKDVNDNKVKLLIEKNLLFSTEISSFQEMIETVKKELALKKQVELQ